MSGYGRDHRARQRSRSPGGPQRLPYREARTSNGDSGYGTGTKSLGETRGATTGIVTGSEASPPGAISVPETGARIPVKNTTMRGTIGHKTNVFLNHFEVLSLPTIKNYQYDVRMCVPESSQRRGSGKLTPTQIENVLGHDALKTFLGRFFVFDGTLPSLPFILRSLIPFQGVSMGWSPELIMPIGESRNTTIDLTGHSVARPNQIDIAIRNQGAINIRGLVKYLGEGNIDLDPMGNPAIEPLLKWINAVYRKDPASRWISRPNSNSHFDRSRETCQSLASTGQVLEAIRGIFQTCQIRFGRLTLNVDTATTAFWTPDKNLVEMVHAICGVPPHKDIEEEFLKSPSRFFASCSRLVGIYFNVKHLKAARNARKVKLNGWSRQDALATVFENTDKTTGHTRMTSVFDYFHDTYHIHLRYPRLPLADTKAGQFPIELCFSSPGERYKEPLHGSETADFIKFATCKPTIRKQQIDESVRKLRWHTLDIPAGMGLSVSPQMMQVNARVLPSPIPQYGAGTDACSPEMGRWNLRNKKLLNPKAITSWGLLYFPASQRADEATLQDFAHRLAVSFQNLGIQMPRELPAFLLGNPNGDVKTMIAEIVSKAASAFRAKPQLLCFLLHGASEHLYRAIKNVCDLQFGVASQVMLVGKALNRRGQPQYLANIALKTNVKVGGINSTIEEPLFKNGSWMLIGGDTTHPSPSQLRMNPPPPSYSGLVATWDRGCTAYTAIASAQAAKEQLIMDSGFMMKELLARYMERNHGSMPDSIIYYRDGLSEGQFNQVIACEAEPLRAVFAEYKKAPKLTIIVAVKRHHTRMFPTERGDENGNVLPGTVVENSSKNDIYLVPHFGLQGTVRPTRYAVLLDENKLSANDFARLTNNLSWTYARATCAVSVVPPIYYADQVCERAKLHVRDAPDGTQFLGPVNDALKYTMASLK